MRRMVMRRRSDGLLEVAPAGRRRRAAKLAAFTLLGLPAALMVLVALVAVLPVLALVIPVALLVTTAGLAGRALEARLAGARRPVARVLGIDRSRAS
jgi:hypothetical protein